MGTTYFIVLYCGGKIMQMFNRTYLEGYQIFLYKVRGPEYFLSIFGNRGHFNINTGEKPTKTQIDGQPIC